MPLSTKLNLLALYVAAIQLTVYLWDERRRYNFFKTFLSEYQLAFQMYAFRFAAPITLVVAGVYLIALFIQ